MTVAAGTRLGPYEIVAPLGAGGMGEVYRARDTRLGRDVAIKTLPQHLSSNPEVRARFEREAKTVSSLNHPNICTLFDVGREGATDFLVMELVDGETLAARLARGALPTAEVIRLGTQIASALDRAHRAGVIHRDLKPGNVMLTKSGAKLMDFGLARATGLSGPEGSGAFAAAMTQSPTVAAPLTAEGTIVGTFQYMAPEQLEGREADARADLWGLGCVLYEMSTGRRAFEGATQASLIGAIMRDAPRPMSEMVPATPPALDRLIQGLLAKDPEERVQTAHDAKMQLGWLAEGGSSIATAVVSRSRHGIPGWLPWTIAGLALAAAVAMPLVAPRRGDPPVIRALVPEPPGALYLFTGDAAGPPAVSPDGKHVAFVAVDRQNGALLWVRDLAELSAHPIASTENATFPFWSPDSRSIGYFADQKLKRADLATGQVISICPAPGGRGGCWSPGGEIVYAPDFQSSLWRVSAMGGAPVALTRIDTTQHTTHRWPQMLPDGRHFLFYAGNHRQWNGAGNGVWIGSLDGAAPKPLLTCLSDAEYSDGHLFYVQDSVLVARPFDPGSRRFTGDATPTPERVQFDVTTWKANFSLARSGIMIYQPIGGSQGSQIQLVDRAGRLLQNATEGGNHFAVTLFPNAKSLLYSSQMTPTGDIFRYDFDRGLTRRLTPSDADEDMPALSPDGGTMAFTARTGATGHYLIESMPVGGGQPHVIYRAANLDVWPLDWSKDGKSLLIGTGDFSSITANGIAVLPLDGSGPPRSIPVPDGGVNYGGFSRDGKWVLYGTARSNETDVYLQPIGSGADDGSGRIQISTHGGTVPRWRGDDGEIYYARPDGMIMAVPMTPGTMQPGREVPLFRAILRPYFRSLDVSPDGQRFLVNVLASEGAAPIVVVSGWERELRKR